jgi:hypothetical protein
MLSLILVELSKFFLHIDVKANFVFCFGKGRVRIRMGLPERTISSCLLQLDLKLLFFHSAVLHCELIS